MLLAIFIFVGDLSYGKEVGVGWERQEVGGGGEQKKKVKEDLEETTGPGPGGKEGIVMVTIG